MINNLMLLYNFRTSQKFLTLYSVRDYVHSEAGSFNENNPLEFLQ